MVGVLANEVEAEAEAANRTDGLTSLLPFIVDEDVDDDDDDDLLGAEVVESMGMTRSRVSSQAPREWRVVGGGCSQSVWSWSAVVIPSGKLGRWLQSCLWFLFSKRFAAF